MEATSDFNDQIHQAWGNSRNVADAAFGELFRHGDEIGLDHDDQVSYAMRIGILAGELKDNNSEVFIQRFETEILNN